VCAKVCADCFHRNNSNRARRRTKGPRTERAVPRFPLGSWINPGDPLPLLPPAPCHSIGGFFAIALSRSFCRPHPNPSLFTTTGRPVTVSTRDLPAAYCIKAPIGYYKRVSEPINRALSGRRTGRFEARYPQQLIIPNPLST
jgi:hypothetical protein